MIEMRYTRILLVVLIMLCGQSILAGDKNPFLTLQYDSLVIYDYDWQGDKARHFSIIDKEGKLAPTVKKSAKLDRQSSEEMSRLLGDRTSFGQGTASCFLPHMGIVYYKAGKPVAHITICVGCNQLRSSLRIPAQEQGKIRLEGEVFYAREGMSKAFREYLYNLQISNNFSHREKPDSSYD
jgi:hypothetical protein